jgi:hypothetical protein
VRGWDRLGRAGKVRRVQRRKTERKTSRNKDEPIQPCFAVFFSWEQAKLPFAAPERFLVLAPLRLPPHPYSDAVAYKSLDPVIQISCPCLPVERHTYHTLRRPHRVLRNLMISQVVSSALIVVVWPHLFYVCVLIFVFSLPAYDLAVG